MRPCVTARAGRRGTRPGLRASSSPFGAQHWVPRGVLITEVVATCTRLAQHDIMRKLLIITAASLLLTLTAGAQNLQSALSKMDAAAAQFRTAQADFVWDQYQMVVDETDTQKGQIYFRRAGDETQMLAAIIDPDKKFVLFRDGMVRLYQPKIEQVTEYKAGKNRDEFESFLVLG